MRRVIAAVIAALPFDPSSRRALDETMLDWAHEEAAAGSGVARAAVAVRAGTSVCRSLMGLTLWEMRRMPMGWVVSRTLLFVAAPSMVLTLARDGGFDAHVFLDIAILVTPIALFAAIAGARRAVRVPAFGLAAVTLSVMAVLGGWSVRSTTAGSRTVRAAVARQFAVPPSDAAAKQVVLAAGLAVLGFTLVLLGASLREGSRRQAAPIIAAVMTMYGVFFGGLPFVEGLDAHAHVAVSFVPWCLAVLSSSLLVSIGRQRELSPT